MHPLSTFPALLTYGLFAPLLLRVMAGIFILSLGWERYKKPYNWSAIIYAIFGPLLILGLFTQISAIVAIGILKFDYYFDFYKNRKTAPVPKNITFLYAVIGIILLSLLVTGPGFLAFDLPL